MENGFQKWKELHRLRGVPVCTSNLHTLCSTQSVNYSVPKADTLPKESFLHIMRTMEGLSSTHRVCHTCQRASTASRLQPFLCVTLDLQQWVRQRQLDQSNRSLAPYRSAFASTAGTMDVATLLTLAAHVQDVVQDVSCYRCSILAYRKEVRKSLNAPSNQSSAENRLRCIEALGKCEKLLAQTTPILESQMETLLVSISSGGTSLPTYKPIASPRSTNYTQILRVRQMLLISRLFLFASLLSSL